MKRKWFRAALLPAAFFVYLSGTGFANAAFLSESGGDLPNSTDATGTGATVFVLEEGKNVVEGNSSSIPGVVGDFDDLILRVPENLVLKSVKLIWTDRSSSFTSSVQSAYRLGAPSDPIEVIETRGGSSALNLFSSVIGAGLGPGDYFLNQLSIGIIGTGAGNFDYKWKFTVVPLPPAVWLFISGVLAMVGLSRRRRAV